MAPSAAARHLEAADHQRRPSRLMTGANTAAVVAVEVLAEEYEILEARVRRVACIGPVARTDAARIRQEEIREPLRDFARDLVQGHEDAGARRALDLERLAVEVVVSLERLDQEIV